REIAEPARRLLRNRLLELQLQHRIGPGLELEYHALVGVLAIGVLARGVGADRKPALALTAEAVAALLVERHRLQAGKEARDTARGQADVHVPVADALQRQRAPPPPSPLQADLDGVFESLFLRHLF